MKIDEQFHNAMYISREVFGSTTGCNFPFRHIEYQQVGQPVMFDPFMQGLALLLTNADITEKTETIVYTFE